MWAWLYYFFKPKSKPMNGIDISHHQGEINFALMKQNDLKIDFIYMKATQGVGYIDPKVKFNSTEAKKHGFLIGYYHFCTLNDKNITTDARQEAIHFRDTIKTLPAPDLPLVLDIEHEDPKVQLSDQEVIEWIRTFFGTLIFNGYKNLVLYSYTPFLNEHLPLGHDLGKYPLWIAAYVNKPEPKLPSGWKEYWLWQYTDKGSVKGIAGYVDMNKSIKSLL